MSADLILNIAATGQSIPNSVLTAITWTSERSDLNGWHAASSSDVIIPPGPTLVTCQLSWGTDTGTDLSTLKDRFHHMELEVGGTARVLCAYDTHPGEYGDFTGVMSAYFNEASTATLRVKVYQDSGGARVFGGANRLLASAGISANTELAVVRLNAAADAIQTATTAAYTLAVADWGTWIPLSLASPANLSVPQDSAAAFPVGSVVTMVWLTGSQPSLALGTGASWAVNPTPGLKFRSLGSVVSVMKWAADTWIAYGDLGA